MHMRALPLFVLLPLISCAVAEGQPLPEPQRQTLSNGPVLDAAGNLVAHFNSIWRLEKDGRWRIVFDLGNPVQVVSSSQEQ